MSTEPAEMALVHAPLKFIEWQALYETEKPFQIFINIPPHVADQRTTNLVFEDVVVGIRNARHCISDLTLDTHGFIFRNHQTKLTNFESQALVEEVYLPETENMLRQAVDEVGEVFFFDWRLRENAPELEGTVIDLNNRTEWLRPALHVHIDQSPSAVLNRIRQQLPDKAAQLLRGRVRVINIWRPLVDKVQDWPLAVADGRTVDKADLVEADHVRRHYTGSTMYLKANPLQQFYYLDGQRHDEVLIFKNFDSDQTKLAQFAPHASFRHPSLASPATPRKSIEVRALVFSETSQ